MVFLCDLKNNFNSFLLFFIFKVCFLMARIYNKVCLFMNQFFQVTGKNIH